MYSSLVREVVESCAKWLHILSKTCWIVNVDRAISLRSTAFGVCRGYVYLIKIIASISDTFLNSVC